MSTKIFMRLTSKKWVFLGCDGPLYHIVIRIIDTHSDKYDLVLLASGLVHQHMNQLKTLFKALNEIILEPFGKVVLNFRLAYCYFVNAFNTYKSFKALEVLLHGTTSEIYHEFSNFVV